MTILLYAVACFLAGLIAACYAIWRLCVDLERERERLSDGTVVREISRQ